MFFIVVLALAVLALIWWRKSQQALNLNERIYLRRRGYDTQPDAEPEKAVARDARLLDLIESLDDVTPYSRERAAEELSLLCACGQSDERMFAPLVTALEDPNAAVRGAAALALGNLGDSRATTPLRRVLETDESAHARAQARRALDKLESEGAGESGLKPEQTNR